MRCRSALPGMELDWVVRAAKGGALIEGCGIFLVLPRALQKSVPVAQIRTRTSTFLDQAAALTMGRAPYLSPPR